MDDLRHHHDNWSALRVDFARVVDRDHWGLGLIMIGWIHLAFSLTYQTLYAHGLRRASIFLPLWALEVAVVTYS
ncbi:MAG: hypothetical protein JO252_11445, partial [Planctomycetaceae bacterium]|nr:hypothetical protein [Planctomycetaceae bacterium]